MKTTIYWTVEHIKQVAHEMRFRAACWWLSQQVEFIDWRLRLESAMPSVQSNPTTLPIRRIEFYPVHPL